MGICIIELEAILSSRKHVSNVDNVLTLGRQYLYTPNAKDIALINSKHELSRELPADTFAAAETFFNSIGWSNVYSMDISKFENANIIHDLNNPVPEYLKSKFQYIFDGGTTEHVFNVPQVLDNIINLLSVGGVVCASLPNNNLSGHGLYQFSPELFLSAFSSKYGMEILEIYLAEAGTFSDKWIEARCVRQLDGSYSQSRFYGSNDVHVIVIARKISDERVSLVHEPPQQFMYDNTPPKAFFPEYPVPSLDTIR
jgi:hypothetical protein